MILLLIHHLQNQVCYFLDDVLYFFLHTKKFSASPNITSTYLTQHHLTTSPHCSPHCASLPRLVALPYKKKFASRRCLASPRRLVPLPCPATPHLNLAPRAVASPRNAPPRRPASRPRFASLRCYLKKILPRLAPLPRSVVSLRCHASQRPTSTRHLARLPLLATPRLAAPPRLVALPFKKFFCLALSPLPITSLRCLALQHPTSTRCLAPLPLPATPVASPLQHPAASPHPSLNWRLVQLPLPATPHLNSAPCAVSSTCKALPQRPPSLAPPPL